MDVPKWVGMATVAVATEVGHWLCGWCSAIRFLEGQRARGQRLSTARTQSKASTKILHFPFNFFFAHCSVRVRGPSAASRCPLVAVCSPNVCLTEDVCCLCSQVLDWIENHGEAFLSKHTGVGKSLHRARALQKRHEDFEEVAQVTF